MNGEQNDYQGMSKYAVYRQIRQSRTYRPLGKITRWRVVLGLALLASVFFISGAVSSSLAARGHFRAADTLMVSKAWMTKYRPELKAFIEAGVLFEDGDYASAFSAFSGMDSSDAVSTMKSRSAVKLAALQYGAGEYDAAFDTLTQADRALLSDGSDEAEEYVSLCRELLSRVSLSDAPEASSRVRQLEAMLSDPAPD